jgi:hypothetical protein
MWMPWIHRRTMTKITSECSIRYGPAGPKEEEDLASQNLQQNKYEEEKKE